MDVRAEVIEEGELARLVRSFEDHGLEPEGVGESIRERRLQIAVVVEQPDTLGGLARFDDELHSAGVEPPPALLEQLFDDLVREPAVVLLPELELHFEPPLVCAAP